MSEQRGDKAAKEERKWQAQLVVTDGSAKDFEDCAKHVPGWENLRSDGKVEMVDRMRNFWSFGQTPEVVVRKSDSGISIGPREEDNPTLYALRLSDTMASQSMAYIDDRIADLATYHRKNNAGGATSDNMSSSMAFVAGAGCQDTVQSSLAVQMAATHDAAMRALGMIGSSEYCEQAKMFGNLATKLLNAYTRQAETLSKLQRGGEQVIKHVHIDNRGGQAVVTDQVITGGQNGKSESQAHGQGAYGSALLGQDTQGNGVPVTSNPGQETVQATWGTIAGSA